MKGDGSDRGSTDGTTGIDAGVLPPSVALPTGLDRSSGTNRPWPADVAFYPEVLETPIDTPLLLGRRLGADADGLRIVGIDGTTIDAAVPTPLPGIRVGQGEGCGFVFRRALDGEIVFVPDADYQGVATIAFRVADAGGAEASFLATLKVRDSAAQPVEIAFANGSQHASVAEGLDAAIVGALTVLGIDASDPPLLSVYEGEVPSERFTISGARLQARSPLDATDGTIVLRIVASEGEREIGSSEFAIEVRAAAAEVDRADRAADQFLFGGVEPHESGADAPGAPAAGVEQVGYVANVVQLPLNQGDLFGN